VTGGELHSIDQVRHSLASFALLSCAAAGATTPRTALSELPNVLADPTPCVGAAAEYHRINPWILKAILKVESNFAPTAINRNPNGTVDVGMGQINSIHFKRLRQYGITPDRLMDGCVSTYVAAWHLAQQVGKYGNTWYGVAAYHSASPCQNGRYSSLVWNVLTEWRVVGGPRLRVPPLSSCTVAAPQPGRRPASSAAASSLIYDASN
jgi:soluble lytic murein transglycosylase-like protein